MLWFSGTINPGLEPYQCLYTIMWVKEPNCHADTQEVSRCGTRGESEESIALKHVRDVREGIHLVLNPRADVTRSP